MALFGPINVAHSRPGQVARCSIRVAVGVIAAVTGVLVVSPAYLLVAAVTLSGGLALVAWRAYATPVGSSSSLDQIVWGCSRFLVAAVIKPRQGGGDPGRGGPRRHLAKPCLPEGVSELP